ncbi:MAG: S8 family peptidase [Acidimicrobiales bacterium]
MQRPGPGRQGARLTPQFGALRDALEGERAQLAESTSAADPELVAVFDLAGTVDGFLRAAAGVDGLEFLTDLQEDRVDPDDDFYYRTEGEVTDDGVPQSLYMVMTNAQAVTELVRMFELWQQDPSVKLERGLNSLKEVFGLLRAIRRWGPEDRVRETGLLEQWREDLAVVGAQGASRIEIELWYRAEADDRARAETQVREIVTAAGGAVIARSEHPSIAYHALLADIPMSQVEAVLGTGPDAIELLTTETIMMVAPSTPMAFPAAEPSPGMTMEFDTTPPSGLPRVALLDGMPLANHAALQGRVVIDDPDDRAANYALMQRNHGSATASLVAHGDLASPGAAIAQPIYLRPILRPHEVFARTEIVPRDELLVDLIHRAFHRMFEGDGDADPSAASVRVVNLSVGDPTRVFVRRLSPLARLLDWLAHRYNLVIVVSGGNHNTIRPTLDADTLADGSRAASALSRSLHEQARLRRLLSPAEAVNAITVGGLHEDGIDVDIPDTVLDVLPAGVPASYSPVGFGFRRSVKPEVMLPGGRQIFRAPPPGASGTLELEPAETLVVGPGLAAASPGVAGELDAITYTHGTSNAAALATRSVNQIFDVLEGLGHQDGEFAFPDPQYHPVLAKTLLVHAAGWHDLLPTMRDMLGLSNQQVRRELTRTLGYGPVRIGRVATADRVRVVLLGAGSIDRDQRHTFYFPLPQSLSASTQWRRLTITLGWLSPINVRSQKYRMARLWFTPPRDELGVAPTEADHYAVEKGTVQHQVLEGDAAVAFVQGSMLSIEVDCRADAGAFPAPTRYGLAASIEVAESVQIDIHDEVRARLREEVRERARAQVGTR